MEITTRNTNTLSPMAYQLLREKGILDQSRNGPVLRLTEPLTIRLTHPRERVNFSPARDANPFFHLVEACAMLVGANNAAFLSHFAKRMMEFSDDGTTFNAFYGTRLRKHFGMNQLNAVIRNLLEKPHSRQEVAMMWDPFDLIRATKDKACNLLLIFAIDQTNSVTMTSVNRSNDAILGMVNGANVVHLSFFHEYVARSVGRPMSSWFHFSNNFHVYTLNPQWDKLKASTDWPDYYPSGQLQVGVPLFLTPDQKPDFDEQLGDCIDMMIGCVESNSRLTHRYNLPFVRDVATLFNAFQMHRLKQEPYHVMREYIAGNVRSEDWAAASIAWVKRRHTCGGAV